MEVLGLLACAALFAGCGDKAHVAEATAEDETIELTMAEWQRSREPDLDLRAKPLADDTSGSAAVAAGGLSDSEAQGTAAVAAHTDTPQWGRAVVLPAGTSAADAVEPFRARPVRIELDPAAKKLSTAESDLLRAHAFGLQLEPCNYTEVEYAVHRQVGQACSRGRTKHFLNGSTGAVSRTAMKSTDGGKEQQVYEMALEYLGTRDGSDHYLLEASIWEPMLADELAKVAAESAPTPWAKSADAIVRSITYDEDFAAEVTINYRADGVAEGQRIRRQSYELVYSGEAFRLKLAEHVLLIFGVHEPVPTDGSPCTECTQLPHLAVGELLAGSPMR